MGTTLYLECYSGISGDMTVGALLDLGADAEMLQRAWKSLSISGFHTKISRVKKAGLDACDFDVILPHDSHDHDMEYLHAHNHQREHLHSHGHHKEHTHSHEHRGLAEILSIIEQADMSDKAKQTASHIFTILGRAEAKAHGTALEDVHFHEVGAVDSIVDIISVAVCLDSLAVSEVIIPVLYEGGGTIRCQHGILPVPVPAVTNILQAHGIPLHMTGIEGEFVTPTGAAIVAAVRTGENLPEQFEIIRTGIGAGKRTYERPSILRAMLIKPLKAQNQTDSIYKLETNMDDCTGEMMGHLFECLMQAGAKDVHYFPVFMKKNRPAYQLDVLCAQGDISALEQIIFAQTTTIGIRRQRMERTILPRETKTFRTAYGDVQAKVCFINGAPRIYPEYDCVVQVCRQTGKPYPEMYDFLKNACTKEFPEK